jgi:hypothetical protein
MARRETQFTKKRCNYEEDQCEERVYLPVMYKDTFIFFIISRLKVDNSHNNGGGGGTDDDDTIIFKYCLASRMDF